MKETFGKSDRINVNDLTAECSECKGCMRPPGNYWWKEGDEIRYFCTIKCLIKCRDKERA